jgi:hypothetical protein
MDDAIIGQNAISRLLLDKGSQLEANVKDSWNPPNFLL